MTTGHAVPPYRIASDASRLVSTLRRTVVEIHSLAGGGAGTAVVLSTRGKDVRIGRGTTLAVRLTSPLTVGVEQ